MSIIEVEATEATEVRPLESDESYATLLAEAYALTPEEFLSLKVAARDVTIFLLLREIAGTVSALEARINEYEAKAQGLATPEGIQKVMSMFMGGSSGKGGSGMGQLLAGMIR